MTFKELIDSDYKGFKYSVIQYTNERLNLAREESLGGIVAVEWWCGYVFIPKNHKYYSRGYDDIPVEVHGGLTFSDNFHIEKSKNYNKYAIGFDFNHVDDHGGSKQQSIEQCENLIDQLTTNTVQTGETK